jgi:hypothetical protein
MRKHKKNLIQFSLFLCIYFITTFIKILQLIINGKIHKVKKIRSKINSITDFLDGFTLFQSTTTQEILIHVEN